MANTGSSPLEFTRLWREGAGSDEDQHSLHWSWEQYAKYSSCKPLDHWIGQPFLFLIGQAGAGKSTYLKQLGARSDVLVVGIKEHREAFWDVVTSDSKWKTFLNGSEEEQMPFTLILDGWDELTEEFECRKTLIRAIASLQNGSRTKLRLRIASRPELPEKKVLESLRNDCPWLIDGNRNEATDHNYRLILAPLCRDQAESLWTNFGDGKPFLAFWNWAHQKGITDWFGHVQTLRYLITSFSDGKEWNSQIELWEEVLQKKLTEEEDRRIDAQRIHFSPNSAKLMDAAGELALLYLLGKRSPIPHTDASSLAGRLPLYGNLSRDAQRFLLSTPIFTPGGLENIHFAQAQEAEFLAARRLHSVNVGLDNQIRLFTSEHGVPEPLQGLCKWLAKYDSDWLNYLTEHHPVMALKSLDSLTEPRLRERVVKDWWTHANTNRNDWDHVQLAAKFIPDQTLPWLEDELCKLNPNTGARCLASWLICLADRNLRIEFLDSLVPILEDTTLDSELTTGILVLLAEKNYGNRQFWEKTSAKWLTCKGGERIAAIASQIQRHGGTTQEILSLFRPVSATHQSLQYSEYLRNFFSILKPDDLDTAVNWVDHLNFKGHSTGFKYSWYGVAIDGLIQSLLRARHINGILQLEARLWKEQTSVESILSDEKESKALLTNEIIAEIQNALIGSDVYLLKYKKRGWFRSKWLLSNAHDKLIRALGTEIKSRGFSRRAELLLPILRFSGVNWVDYLDPLCEAQQELQNRLASREAETPLSGILGPRILGSDSAYHERKTHFDLKHFERQNDEHNQKQECIKSAAWNEFYTHVSEFKDMEWSVIYNWLSYGYHIEDSVRMALPMDAFLQNFWKSKLSEGSREVLFKKAKNCLTSFQWNDTWTNDFAQKKLKSTSQYTTHYVTLAPLFAWLWVWHERGDHQFNAEFKDIDRDLWLKYLWAMESYHHHILDDSHFHFLCQTLNSQSLQQQWWEQIALLGESASIPRSFLKHGSGSIHEFVKALFATPFKYPLEEGSLQTYAQENGPAFLHHWFDDWTSRNATTGLENWEQLRFLLLRGVEPAWNWFLDYCMQNDSEVESKFREINMSRDTRGLSAFSHWSEETLIKCIIVVQTHFPQTSDPTHDGVYISNWRDNMAEFRNSLLSILLNHSDWNLEGILDRLKTEIPGFDPWDFIDQKAKQYMANHHLVQMDATQVAAILDSQGVVILKDESDLAQWVQGLIQEFGADSLNGENGLATLLWDEHVKLRKTSLFRGLKHEEAFSDLLFHWLKWRKLKSPLVPKREVQIFRRSCRNLNPSPHEEGQRMDLDLEFHRQRVPLRLAIEVKRDSNREWSKDGLFQLRDYLDRLRIHHGIYIVYGECKRGKDRMLNTLAPHIRSIELDGFHIHPVIIGV